MKIEAKKADLENILMKISDDEKSNPFRAYYDVTENQIKKVNGDDKWHILKFDGEIPKSGRFSFGINIKKSKLNCI